MKVYLFLVAIEQGEFYLLGHRAQSSYDSGKAD